MNEKYEPKYTPATMKEISRLKTERLKTQAEKKLELERFNAYLKGYNHGHNGGQPCTCFDCPVLEDEFQKGFMHGYSNAKILDEIKKVEESMRK